jgi:predicted double-glycine peptidase
MRPQLAARARLLSVGLFAGLAPVDDANVRVRSLAEIRHESVVIQKWDTSCGAAALATLLTYDLADPVSEREIATAMLRRTDPIRVRVRGGFSLLDLQQYAEARGYEAAGYGQVTLADLQQFLPAIVPVRLHGFDHFVVVRSLQGDKVHFADPAFGRRAMSVERFDRAWKLKVAFAVSRP